MPSRDPSFADLRRAAGQSQGSELSTLSRYIPETFTWRDLARELARPDDLDQPARVVALQACLDAEPSRLQAGAAAEDRAARRQVRSFVAQALCPLVGHGGGGDDDEEVAHGDATLDRRDEVVRRCQSIADAGVAVLERVGPPALGALLDDDGDDDDADQGASSRQALYTMTALADAGQPWTTDTAAARVQALLAGLFGDAECGRAAKARWIADGILKRYLRPLFARARPATVTESGRRTAYAGGGGGPKDMSNPESPKTKPWKYRDLRAVSVFAWALHEADGPLIRSNWPLFIPVLLALVDDPDTAVRARGLTLLRAFVDAVPDKGALLHTTGLDSVLADAVFPTLLFLPRLTPEAESLQLLAPAYQALLSLAAAAAAGGSGGGAQASAPGIPPKPAADLLDRILRDGVFAGFFHAGEHIRITEELVRQAGQVVQAMGLYAVKHLKDLIPMYEAILTDPFAMRYKPAVAAAAAALQTTIAACWPRFANTPWQEETLKMLMLCWLNLDEDAGAAAEAHEARALRETLVRAADTLLAVLRAARVDLGAAVGSLVAKEPRLGGLFHLQPS